MFKITLQTTISLALVIGFCAPVSFAQSVSMIGSNPDASNCYKYAKIAKVTAIAIRTCTEAISDVKLTKRDRAAVYINRGILNRLDGEYKKAFDDYNMALTIIPNMPEAIGNRGNIYYLSEKFERAIQDYQDSIKFGISDEKVVRLNTAMALSEMKKNHEAKTAFEDLLERYPEWEMGRQAYDRFKARTIAL